MSLSSASPLLRVNRLTPEVGAEVSGIDLSNDDGLSAADIAAIDEALLAHKVLVFRQQTAMTHEHQASLVRGLNRHWGLEARSDQQKFTYGEGGDVFRIRMLKSKPDTAGTVWQVASLAADGELAKEQPLNPAAVRAGKRIAAVGQHLAPTTTAAAVNTWPFISASSQSLLQRSAPRPETRQGAFALKFGGTGNWVRRGHEDTNATNVWHSDDNYILEPPWCTTLHAVRLPSCGGDTLFTDMGLAFDGLSSEAQRGLSKLAVVDDWTQVFPHYEAGSAEYAELRRHYPRVLHPLVRTHPVTGQRVLYANAIYSTGLVPLSRLSSSTSSSSSAATSSSSLVPAEQAEQAEQAEEKDIEKDDRQRSLLRDIFALPNVPEYQARVQWRSSSDFVLWDNRQLQHYAVGDYGGEAGRPGGSTARLMEHMATLGDRPFCRCDDGSIARSRFLLAGDD